MIGIDELVSLKQGERTELVIVKDVIGRRPEILEFVM